MKDALILEHKIFISAKRAVQISGYKNDYIGQLCREGKLDCKMVGRSWFVTEESLQNHCLLSKQELVLVDDKKLSSKMSAKNAQAPTEGDSIILDRKNFISAKKAAEVSGYSSDYVGQLCRLGKLESTRVGKAWFVSEKSLLNHCITSAHEASVVPVVAQVASPVASVASLVVTPVIQKENISKISHAISLSHEEITRPSFMAVSSFVVAVIAIVFLYQSLFISNFNSKESSASVISSSLAFVDKFFSYLFGRSDRAIVEKVEESPPIPYGGLAVIPSSDSVSQDDLIKEKIKSSFSDEVEVIPDKSGSSGIITPVFKKAKGENFVYVLVPVKK